MHPRYLLFKFEVGTLATPPETITPLLPTTVFPVLTRTPPPPAALLGFGPRTTVLEPDGCLPKAMPPLPPPFRICGKMILLVDSPAVAVSTRRAPIRSQDGGNINLPLRLTQPLPGASMMASSPGQSTSSRLLFQFSPPLSRSRLSNCLGFCLRWLIFGIFHTALLSENLPHGI